MVRVDERDAEEWYATSLKCQGCQAEFPKFLGDYCPGCGGRIEEVARAD